MKDKEVLVKKDMKKELEIKPKIEMEIYFIIILNYLHI